MKDPADGASIPSASVETMESPLLDAYVTQRCEVRLQNSLDHRFSDLPRRQPNDAEQRRIDAGRAHEAGVIDALTEQLGERALRIDAGERSSAQRATVDAMTRGVPVIANAWLPVDSLGRRIGRPDLLVKVEDGYLPVEIKLHLLTTSGGGTLEASTLAEPFPSHATLISSRRFRRGDAWFNDSLQLAHYHRMLEALGLAATADGLLGGVIDGSSMLWWIDVDLARAGSGDVISEYDQRFAERLELATQTLARNRDASVARAKDPWWHKECLRCPFEEVCHHELESVDDVSLVRWSSEETLSTLRSLGITTRAALAGLDLGVIDLGQRLGETTLSFTDLLALARDASPTMTMRELIGPRMGVRRHVAAAGFELVGDLLERDERSLALAGQVTELGRLVRRARAGLAGGVLRSVDADALDAARADVEVDVDMESYDHATYLWGALVTVHAPLDGVDEGYRPFGTFDVLDDEAEARIFAEFWSWMSSLRARAASAGLTFRAYCFWRAAEEGQMRRAVRLGSSDLPSERELEQFFASAEWVDLHQLARDQLVTEGPLGLKALATLAGFSWRDEDPSGEASMGWYEEARDQRSVSARDRLLAYNEDDVRATRALRGWLAGPARDLPHVDDVPQRIRHGEETP